MSQLFRKCQDGRLSVYDSPWDSSLTGADASFENGEENIFGQPLDQCLDLLAAIRFHGLSKKEEVAAVVLETDSSLTVLAAG